MTPIYVVGVGGTGSWLALCLSRLVDPKTVTLIDHDKIEERNFMRQLWSEDELGLFKSDCMAKRTGCLSSSRMFTPSYPIPKDSVLFCCADNHKARTDCLEVADMTRSWAIIAGNGTDSAEAYIYIGKWKKGHLDPRVFYPDLLEPPKPPPEFSCTSPMADPQLSLANMTAAAFALKLFRYWTIRKEKHGPSMNMALDDPGPCHFKASKGSVYSITIEQKGKSNGTL